MPVFKQFATKKPVSDVVPGELFLAPIGLDPLVKCIAIRPEPIHDTLMSVRLEAFGQAAAFTYDHVSLHDQCISYGVDWIFEVPADANYAFDIERQSLAGAVTLTDDGFALRTISNEARLRNLLLDLQSLRGVQLSDRNATVSQWRLWANDEHRQAPNATPLMIWQE